MDGSARIVESFRSRDLPAVMGILNVTPDSFYDGGEYKRLEAATKRAETVRREGADLLDVGGESTRPGAEPVPAEEERRRVVPVVRRLRDRDYPLPISVDTSKADVAEAALDAGADWVNDVTALRGDERMGPLLAERDVPVVLMHMQGTPRTMQQDPVYEDVIEEVREFLTRRARAALAQGVAERNILVDPGVGFGKTAAHNRRVLREVSRFRRLGFPVLVGHSRKSFLESALGTPPEDRLFGTLAVSSHLIRAGVDVLRVHDVRAHVELRETLHWLHSEQENK